MSIASVIIVAVVVVDNGADADFDVSASSEDIDVDVGVAVDADEKDVGAEDFWLAEKSCCACRSRSMSDIILLFATSVVVEEGVGEAKVEGVIVEAEAEVEVEVEVESVRSRKFLTLQKGSISSGILSGL